MTLLRADSSFKGKVSFVQQSDGVLRRLRGGTRVKDIQIDTLAQMPTATQPFKPKEALPSWKTMNLRLLDVALTPGASTRVDVQETVLNDFYARLILREAG